MNLSKMNWGFNSLVKLSISYSFAILSIVLTLVPESAFDHIKICTIFVGSNIIINRCFLFIIIFSFVYIIIALRQSICIEGHNYKVKVKYGDIFEFPSCKKVIGFDECYTSEVGREPHQINPESICGQFLSKHTNINIADLIFQTGLTCLRKPSDFRQKNRYQSGSLLPYDDYLLLAFARLNKDGLGVISREEYVACLSKLWKEIDKYYGQVDIVMPVLGAGVTRFNGESLTQQQLVDMMIASYQLSSHKIKKPNTLYIVCRKSKDFSLNKIGQYI